MKKKGFIINGVGENDDVDGFLAVVSIRLFPPDDSLTNLTASQR